MLQDGVRTPSDGATMKVTIEIDCTPVEARQFMGLPDVQPMQAAVMAEIEKQVMAEAAKFSPDGFLRAWFGEGRQGRRVVPRHVPRLLRPGRRLERRRAG